MKFRSLGGEFKSHKLSRKPKWHRHCNLNVKLNDWDLKETKYLAKTNDYKVME